MTRSDADSWDLASSVGATATMVAAARALATREADPLIRDPYAEPLVRAVGIDFFVKLIDGQVTTSDVDDGGAAALMTGMMAVRTRFFDDFFLDAAGAGVRQAVILASGLDSRAYRLPWPNGTVVYEIDQPQVIEAKTATMADIGAVPSADRRAVAVDLRDDWPSALTAAGFDTGQPTAWSAEGLLVYLPPDAQDRLFDDITALSAPGSRLATEYHPDGGASMGERASAISEAWKGHGFDVNLTDLFYAGERRPVVDYLTGLDWRVTSRTRPEVFAGYGRDFPDTGTLAPMRNSLSVIATKN
ncbi:class I SAM-dependent methyltransferase [Mycobacterium sp. URHB0044]|uniref:class I SAM-dependent methyltransferase n=1 Tax=Mycobacterium sp. URHB0044 TaxID=1380386 RepID=UPI00048AB70A|nr:class I SAM-dependent methyltransferase [Mycobacterium sp. URHB0044]